MDTPCPRLVPAAFWNGCLGEPGRILVVGSHLDTHRLRSLLPPAWPMVAVSEPDSVLGELGEASLLCVCFWVESANPAMWQETARLCSVAGIPILGVPRPGEWRRTNAAERWSLLRPQNLFLSETDSPLILSRWVLEKSTARFFPALSAIGLEGAPRIPLLRGAIRLLTDRAQEGKPLASLSEVASGLGCHRSTLWRAERSGGLALPEAIRRVRVAFAACRYGGSWDEVSAVVDMTPSGVAHRFRRTLRCTRSDAPRKTFGELVLWVAESMVGREEVPGGVEFEE